MKQINESLDHLDFKDEVYPVITVDEYAAKMGKDKDVITVTFMVKSQLCGQDLVSWLESGYDFVLDADLSTGELDDNKWLVFVEMDRRTSAPADIIEILEDLETLTGLSLDDYVVKINDQKYKADKDVLRSNLITSPKEYAKIKRREEKDDELNQMRDIANLERPEEEQPEPVPMDNELKEFINRAGL
mgnify:CR=1 FL=1